MPPPQVEKLSERKVNCSWYPSQESNLPIKFRRLDAAPSGRACAPEGVLFYILLPGSVLSGSEDATEDCLGEVVPAASVPALLLAVTATVTTVSDQGWSP